MPLAALKRWSLKRVRRDIHQTDTMTGTYTTQSNGNGVMLVTPTGTTNTSSFSILVQPAPSAVGPVVARQGMSLINNENSATGTAVRVK